MARVTQLGGGRDECRTKGPAFLSSKLEWDAVCSQRTLKGIWARVRARGGTRGQPGPQGAEAQAAESCERVGRKLIHLAWPASGRKPRIAALNAH